MGTNAGAYQTIPIYKKTTGLNMYSDPTRLTFDLNSGVLELAVAYNVDIDYAGRISRRKFGSSRLQSWNVKDLFCDGGECLFVSEGTLYKLGVGLERVTIRENLTQSARMWYKQTPTGAIYYANGFERGIVKNGVNLPWSVTPYVGPATNIVYSDPPVGITQLELYHSRIFTVARSTLWYSERYAWNWFDLASGYVPFASDITCIGAVYGDSGGEAEGIYVGTEGNGTVYLEGNTPSEFSYRRIHSGNPILGTMVAVDSDDIGEGKVIQGRGVMWVSDDGVWVGGPGGQAMNLTRGKLQLPSSREGTACIYRGKYIALLQE